MKKLILILIGIILSGTLLAQNGYNYPLYLGKVGVSSGTLIFRGSTSGTATLRVPPIAGTNTILSIAASSATDTIATRAYARGYGGTGTVNSSDTAAMLTNYIERQDTAAMLINYIERKDTASMLTRYIERKDTTGMLSNYIERQDTATMLTNYIERKDTSSMLTRYIERKDTSSMLTNYIERKDTASMLGNYIERKDTALMLANYALLSETGTGDLSASDTAAMLLGYDNRIDNLETVNSNALNLSTEVTLLSDTIPLFTVGAGNNLRGSQASFVVGADLGGWSNSSNKDTLYITSGRFFVVQDSGTVTMGFRFYKHATTYPTSASTDMMSNVITLSAATNAASTGTVITHTSTPHFDVLTVLPGESIAGIVTVQSNGNMPKLMRGTVYGYKVNRKY